MAPSYDCAVSVLLCAEDNDSILSFDEEEENGHGDVDGHRPGCVLGERSCFYRGLLMDFPVQSDECIALLVERECEHLPRRDYAERLLTGALDLSIRRDAIDWICKVHSLFSFRPLSAYLSVNYLDRFLSVYELAQGKAWMTQLLSVACLSLAAKMEEVDVPLLVDLQIGEVKYVFEANAIQRMELLVLSTLKWRMQSITPFSFIDYFLHKYNAGNAPSRLLVLQSEELIWSTIRGTDFLTFRPSEIAAAVALIVLGKTHIVELEQAVTYCIHVEKKRVLRCHEVIQDMILMRNLPLKTASPSNSSSVPQSPIGVLEAACFSYKSDDITVWSQEICYDISPDNNKRRKISR